MYTLLGNSPPFDVADEVSLFLVDKQTVTMRPVGQSNNRLSVVSDRGMLHLVWVNSFLTKGNVARRFQSGIEHHHHPHHRISMIGESRG